MAVTAFIPKLDAGRVNAVTRLSAVLMALDAESGFDVKIEPRKRRRSISQNRMLWAIYSDIIQKGGEAMAGWDKDDLHTFFLMNHFGSETIEMFGKKKQVPLRRSSKLNKQEFTDLVESILRFMAERGVFISMPGEIGG